MPRGPDPKLVARWYGTIRRRRVQQRPVGHGVWPDDFFTRVKQARLPETIDA
jgi:hypothetical protein